ncbi:uncharacterized protein LOC120349663 [Nilaparvata lugens]|uniref:uncharacterized protein LOC120349663 n=1 Tax=Nilaparvata lugens TaxID=108931 RepID=UPI00193E1CE5|nr:uncharacterized protein LOC120349663 [Nilaparvata lugens]
MTQPSHPKPSFKHTPQYCYTHHVRINKMSNSSATADASAAAASDVTTAPCNAPSTTPCNASATDTATIDASATTDTSATASDATAAPTAAANNAEIAGAIFREGRVFKPVTLENLAKMPRGVQINLRYAKRVTSINGEGITAELEREYDYARCFMPKMYINTVFKRVGEDPVDMTGYSVIIREVLPLKNRNRTHTLEFFKNGILCSEA